MADSRSVIALRGPPMPERTPADEISQAAATLREAAAKATEGPWIAEYSGPTGNCVIPHDAQSTREHVAKTQLYHAQADAEWIALMSPVLAEPLAAWLESWDGFDVPESAPHSDDWEHALKVSRAINANRKATP